MKLKRFSLYLMVVLYLAAGINHFRNPGAYLPLIPPYLKYPQLINTLAGLSEMLLALGLMFKRTRKTAAWGIILMLVAFIPSHIYMIQQNGCFDKPSFCFPVWVMWRRLLVFQPLLILWAWSIAKNESTRKLPFEEPARQMN